jgi:hypothetical protein
VFFRKTFTMHNFHILGLASASALLIICSVAHSWVEQLQVVHSNGYYIGKPGYSRGYVPRNSPSFADALLTYKLPPNGEGRSKINATDLLCSHTQQQWSDQQTNQWPQLQAQAGDYIAIKYLENGHVTQPDIQSGKPGSGGLVYIYATTQPQINEKLANVLRWTPQGDLTQGRLLAVNNFDDGRCYQISNSPISQERQKSFPDSVPGSIHEQWCETDIQIPFDAPAGGLSIFWVWQWPTLPNGSQLGFDEIYTTCSDVQIGNTATTVNPGNFEVPGQDPQPIAVPDFKQRAANITLPSNSAFYGWAPELPQKRRWQTRSARLLTSIQI